MRCGFTRTTSKFGPRNGIHSKVWRCSRKGKYLYKEHDDYYNGKPCYLCGQHKQLVEKKD